MVASGTAPTAADARELMKKMWALRAIQSIETIAALMSVTNGAILRRAGMSTGTEAKTSTRAQRFT
jgi:hypothetical protein